MSSPAPERDLESRLESLARPAARPEFRSTLRERFLAGAAAAPPVDVLPEDHPVARRSGAPSRRKVWIALAAAAGVVAMLYLFKPAPLVWHVLPGSTATTVRVDGERLRLDDAEALGRALNDAHSVLAEDGELRLARADQYAVEIARGARVSFSLSGNTGGTDPFSLELEGAALRVVTGPGFPGHVLALRSGDAIVHVTGTAFAFDNCTGGACVCGLHGRIEVLRKGGKPTTLDGGKQCWVPTDGGELTWGEVHAAHITPVQELARVVETQWKR